MWKIEKDLINDPDQTAVGVTGDTINVGLGIIVPEIIALPEGEKISFRLQDDDGEVYYKGTLDDDDEGLNQQAALSWAQNDAGCTTIEVLRNGSWVQDIG